MTNIEELIENLEAEVGSAWQLPMSGGKVLLDIKEIKKLLTQIKEGLPESIVQARRIVEDRSKIIDKARNDAQGMLKVSEEKIREMLDKHEIVRQAQVRAESIINEANSKAEMLKKTSEEYSAKIIKNLDDMVLGYLEEIKKLKSKFKIED